MTPTTPMTRTVIFHTRPGPGGPPAERLPPELVEMSKDTSLLQRHRVAEEIDVGVSGTGRITVDDDAFELQPLAFGSHSPGDAETAAGRQRA